MKKFENLTKEELWKLRKEVVVNSLYYSDYHNSFGFNEHSMCNFFDSWLSYMQEEMKEDGHSDAGDKFFDYFDEYDNADFLWEWFMCYDDFDWVEYDEDAVKEAIHDYLDNLEESEKVAVWNEYASENKYPEVIMYMEDFPDWVRSTYPDPVDAFEHGNHCGGEFNGGDAYWYFDASEALCSVDDPMDVYVIYDFFNGQDVVEHLKGVTHALNRKKHEELFDLIELLDD